MSRIFREAVVIAALALLPATFAAFFHPHRVSWNESVVGPDEISVASAMYQTDPMLWVDARPKKEYEEQHIPKAVNLNMDEWNRQLPVAFEAWQPGSMIVVYCNNAECHSSREVADRMRDAGFAPVYTLKGGWEAWLRANQ